MQVQNTPVSRPFFTVAILAILLMGGSSSSFAQQNSNVTSNPDRSHAAQRFAGPLDRLARGAMPKTVATTESFQTNVQSSTQRAIQATANSTESVTPNEDTRLPASVSTERWIKVETLPPANQHQRVYASRDQDNFQLSPTNSIAQVSSEARLPMEIRNHRRVAQSGSDQCATEANLPPVDSQDFEQDCYIPESAPLEMEPLPDTYASGYPRKYFFGLTEDDYCDKWENFCGCNSGCVECGECNCGGHVAHCLKKLFGCCHDCDRDTCHSCHHRKSSSCGSANSGCDGSCGGQCSGKCGGKCDGKCGGKCLYCIRRARSRHSLHHKWK